MLNASMLHNLPQGLIQDAEEDHACQHHHCCHTLHHISWSQRTDYSAVYVAHSFASELIWVLKKTMPASNNSVAAHCIMPAQVSIRTSQLPMWHRICLVSIAVMLHNLFY